MIETNFSGNTGEEDPKNGLTKPDEPAPADIIESAIDRLRDCLYPGEHDRLTNYKKSRKYGPGKRMRRHAQGPSRAAIRTTLAQYLQVLLSSIINE